MGNIMGSNDHYDIKMTGDGELATKDSKEAEKCALALYPITSYSLTPTSSRSSHPLHAFCFGLVVLQRRLSRRHSSSKSKHDNQLHPEAEKLRAAA